MKTIAVLGGGSTGLTAAGYFGMKGFKTILCDTDSYQEALAPVKEAGGVTLTGAENGFGPVALVTNSFAKAVQDADLILVCVVASRHEEISKAIAPYLKDGQHILISPGNLGCFIFDRVFREAGTKKDLTISVLEGNLFPCRIVGPAKVIVGFKLGKKKIAAYPSSDTARAIEMFSGVAEFIPAKNAFECAVNFVNFVIHLSSGVLSAVAVEKDPNYNIYESSMTPSVLSCAERLEAEREALAKAMGIEPVEGPIQLLRDAAEYSSHPYLEYFHTLKGPSQIRHRYYTEDAYCNGAFLLSVAERLQIPVPTLSAFVEIVSTMLQYDFRSNGRTLDNLGFAGKDFSEILRTI